MFRGKMKHLYFKTCRATVLSVLLPEGRWLAGHGFVPRLGRTKDFLIASQYSGVRSPNDSRAQYRCWPPLPRGMMGKMQMYDC